MKTLTLLRHAKTERESDTGRDFDRRLDARGQGDARRMGDEIKSLELAFDLTLCSPAARAAETARLASLSPRYDERIYNASAGDLLDMVRTADASIGRLLMVGHNPGFEQLASMLSGTSVDMATGSLAEIQLPIDRWDEVGRACGKLLRLVSPKELA